MTTLTIEKALRDPYEVEEEARRLSIPDLVERERANGVRCGPFERRWLLDRAPLNVRASLELARRRPDVRCDRQYFQGVAEDFPSASFTAVTASATETNLWTPAVWTPIPAMDMRAGKMYKVAFGGVFTSTATQGVLTWTPRAGQSSTPASNVTLGASNATAPPASLTAQAWYGEFTLGIRAVDIAYTAITGTGNGFVLVQGAAAATGIVYVLGGAVATTIANNVASGLIVSLTISVASQSYTCQWANLIVLN